MSYSTASSYASDTRFDNRGVRLLATAVLRQSFVDYVEALVTMYSMKHPFYSENTFRKYNAVFNTCCKRIKQRTYRTRETIRFHDDPVESLKEIREEMADYYYVVGERLLRNREFIESDRFLLFSDRISADAFIKMAEEMAEEWRDKDEYEIHIKGVEEWGTKKD